MMEYVDYSRYVALYGDIEEIVFHRLLRKASQIIDYETTGVDGYAKLKNAYPTAVEDVDAVQYCVCELINAMYRDDKAVELAEKANSFTQREDGTFAPNKISSINSGSESISFASGTSSTVIKDTQTLRKGYRDIVSQCLYGVKDANGVNLLYMGGYPRVRKNNNLI